MKNFLNTIRGRILASLVLGVFLAWVFSEVAFLILRDSSDRAPRNVELVIPAGTAERVAAGQPVPAIPANLTFVLGDVLTVQNQDTASHQLGPLWIPAGANASLSMDRENNFAYECTFQTTKYFGLDVRPRVTTLTRVQALTLAGPPMAALLFVYSFVMWPLRQNKKTKPAQPN
jgi:hypothetical protein